MKNFPWILPLALLPLFSKAMDTVYPWNELPKELRTKIILDNDDTFTALRQTDRSAHDLGDTIKTENQHKILTSLISKSNVPITNTSDRSRHRKIRRIKPVHMPDVI
jgi:hypothetical protein